MNIIDVPFTNGTYTNGIFALYKLYVSSMKYDTGNLSCYL